jgi:di/tricarboxylate transporter
VTTEQGLAFALVAGTMAAFLWGRLRYDLVAAGALLAGLALGVVEPEDAFAGFSDDIVIIVGGALVVSAAIARSGVMEAAFQRLAPGLTAPALQIAALVVAVTALSAFVKNIGALTMLLPVAFQMAKRSGAPPSAYLMPMAFGSLLGGLVTQIGTSPNVIVSRIRGEIAGEPFTMFDFAPVGALLAAGGALYLVLARRLVPERAPAGASLDEAIEIKNYTTEATVTEKSAVAGKTVADLQKLGEGEAKVTAIVSPSGARRSPLPDAAL